MVNNYLYVPAPDGLVGEHIPFDDRSAPARREAWATAKRVMQSRPDGRGKCFVWRKARAPIPSSLPLIGVGPPMAELTQQERDSASVQA